MHLLLYRVYADAARITRSRTNAWSSNMSNPLSQEKFIYNDATAVAYQEWMVVKKNKFGRRQDRYIGKISALVRRTFVMIK